MTCIAENLCYGCSSLQSINIPAAVTRIGAHAFEGTKLKRFELPQGLEQIEDGVFACCEDLESFFIPATVTEISESTFCRMHGEIIVEEGNPVYTSENGALYRDGGKTLMYVQPQADYAFTIPPRVEHITSYALYRSFVWRRITLHSGIKNIGDEAIRAAQICAPIGVPPEQIGKNAFCLRRGSDSRTFCELPIDYLPQEAYRRRLALGFCINHARYAPEYAENYMAYIRQNLDTLKSMANKQKLKQVQEFLAEIEAQMPLTVPADYSKLKSEGHWSGLCVQCAEKAWLGQEDASLRASEGGKQRGLCGLKKIKDSVLDARAKSGNRTVRLMFEDEAGLPEAGRHGSRGG